MIDDKLSAEASRLLGVERSHVDAADAARIERLGARLAATLPAGAFAAAVATKAGGAAVAEAASRSAKLLARAKLGAALAFAAAVGAGAEHARMSHVQVVAPPAPIASLTEAASSTPKAEPPVIAPTDLPSTPTASPRPTHAVDTPSPAADTATRDQALHDERTLLDRARTALSRGDANAALDALRESEKKHPTALLAEEREAYFVLALIRAGQRDAADQRAKAFRRRHPASIFLPTVDEAMAGER